MPKAIYYHQRVLELWKSEDEGGAAPPESLRIRPNELAEAVRAFFSGSAPRQTLFVDTHASWDELLRSAFTVIQTGGGLVENDRGEFLLIRRMGHWDLPKGKLDEGETIEACAMREVEEETGVSGLELQKLLLVSYHTYRDRHIGWVLKENFWYWMRTSDQRPPVPQTEEDIESCLWAVPEQLQAFRPEMFLAVCSVIDARLG